MHLGADLPPQRPSHWGTQAPFTNLTFDWEPEDLREQIPVIAGEEMPFAYGDLQGEMDMINRAYIEVMITGDAKGRVFPFPIRTTSRRISTGITPTPKRCSRWRRLPVYENVAILPLRGEQRQRAAQCLI